MYMVTTKSKIPDLSKILKAAAKQAKKQQEDVLKKRKSKSKSRTRTTTISRVPIGGGTREFLVDGKFTTKKPKSSAPRKKIVDAPAAEFQTVKVTSKVDFAGKLRTKPRKTSKIPFSQLDKRTQDLLKGKSIIQQQGLQAQQDLFKQNALTVERQKFLFRRAPRDVVQGIFEVGKEIVELGVGAVTGASNYGRNLIRRSVAAGGGTRPIEFLISDIGKIGSSVKNVTSFVAKNPHASLVIVGAASALTGRSLKNAFIENPTKALTKAIVILKPGVILKPLGAGAKAIAGSKKVQSVLNARKFPSLKFKVSSDLVSGVSKITGTTKGKFVNGKSFTSTYKLKVNTKLKDSDIVGTITTKVGKRTIIEKVRLQDKGGFYLDLNTGARVPKIRAPIKSRSITIKETKFIPDKTTKSIKPVSDGVLTSIKGDFISTITRIVDTNRKVTVRKGKLGKAIFTNAQKAQIKVLSTQLSKTVKKGRSAIQKPLSTTQIKKLEDFISQIGASNLKGLDRRTAVAKALGVTKTNPSVIGFEKILNDKGKVIGTIARKAKVVSTGEVKALIKPTRAKFQGRKISQLRKNKKGQFSVVQNDKIQLIQKSKSPRLQTPRFIQIPALRSKIPLSITNLRRLGVLGKTTKVLARISGLKKINLDKLTTSQLNKQINEIKLDLKKINEIIQEKKLEPGQLSKAPPSLKSATVGKGGKKTPRVPPKTLRGRSPPPKKPRKIPTPKLTFRTKLQPGQRLAFDYKFKQGGKVRTVKSGLPLNKALLKATNAVDNSTQRSLELVISGVTKAKDVPKTTKLNKFTTRKSLKTLKLVEKSKHAIDTKGEKRGLKLSKFLKSKTKKKVMKKKKVSKRA